MTEKKSNRPFLKQNMRGYCCVALRLDYCQHFVPMKCWWFYSPLKKEYSLLLPILFTVL